MRGGAGGCKGLRDSEGGGRGAGGRTRDGGGTKSGKVGATRGMTEGIETTAAETSGRRRTTEDPPVGTKDNGTKGKYRVDRTGTNESAPKRAEWSGDETEGLESEEEAETEGGAGEVGMTLKETAEELERSGAEYGPGGAAAGGGATSDTNSKDADAAGAGGRHGAEKRERERVSGRRENLARRKTWPASPLEGEKERVDPRPLEWRKPPGGISREWEVGQSRRGAPTTPEWRSCPGEKKPVV